MHLDIVSAEEKIFSGLVEVVVATGDMGELGIYPGHTPLVTSLKPGFIRVTKQGGESDVFYVSGGMLEVQPSFVTVLADTVSLAGDLDEAAALAAKEQAEKALSDKQSEMDYTAPSQSSLRLWLSSVPSKSCARSFTKLTLTEIKMFSLIR